MAQRNCSNQKCTGKANGRNVFCSKCWFHVPGDLRAAIRKDSEKGEHTLRAQPSREWLSMALRSINDRRPVSNQVSEIV